MMKKIIVTILMLIMTLCFAAEKLSQGTYAVFVTSMGNITCALYPDKAPITVKNFIGLATGAQPWMDATGKKIDRPLYTNLIFHRVIPNFMIQGGDPSGTGRGGPGYRFQDEFDPSLKHDKAGRLSMANSGPNTNGSQFFITHIPTPWLDNKHTIFGQVVEGMDVVTAIGNVPRDQRDKPLKDVILKEIIIKTIIEGKDGRPSDKLELQQDKPVILE